MRGKKKFFFEKRRHVYQNQSGGGFKYVTLNRLSKQLSTYTYRNKRQARQTVLKERKIVKNIPLLFILKVIMGRKQTYAIYQRGTGRKKNYMKYQQGTGLRQLLSNRGIYPQSCPRLLIRRRRRRNQSGAGIVDFFGKVVKFRKKVTSNPIVRKVAKDVVSPMVIGGIHRKMSGKIR